MELREPVPHQNPAILHAHRGAYDERLKRAILQLDVVHIPPDASPADPMPPAEKLTLFLNEGNVSRLLEDLVLLRRFFSPVDPV